LTCINRRLGAAHKLSRTACRTPRDDYRSNDTPRPGGRAHRGDTAMPLSAEHGGPLCSEHALIRRVMSQ